MQPKSLINWMFVVVLLFGLFLAFIECALSPRSEMSLRDIEGIQPPHPGCWGVSVIFFTPLVTFLIQLIPLPVVQKIKFVPSFQPFKPPKFYFTF